MSILLPAIAVAIAAFFVWLAVRFVNRRGRWAQWTALVLVVLTVLYVAGFGPVRRRLTPECPNILFVPKPTDMGRRCRALELASQLWELR